MRVHVKKKHENPKEQRAAIDLHEKEVGPLVHKLYRLATQEDVCAHCGKKSEFVRVIVDDMTKVKGFKICKECMVRK